MEPTFKTYLLLISILFTGLSAGLCFTWSNAITPGIGKLDDFTFLQSFQSMNRAIINRNFLIVFFGPTVLLFINAFLYRNVGQRVFIVFLLAALLYFVGLGLVTVLKNVPLNEILDKAKLETATTIELSDLRKTFEKSWNKWHMVRTVSTITSFSLLLLGMAFSK